MRRIKETMLPKVSIIIPVYNIRQYLPETLDCILRQTFRDFEVMLVDDGSKDGTDTICDEYAARDHRIKVIHKPNGGPSEARNVGLDASSGEWIYFLDGDDLIADDALEVLLKTAEKTGAEIVAAPFVYFRKTLPKRHRRESTYTTDGKGYVKATLYQKKIDNGVCGKLFARHLWKDLRFTKGILYEDLDIIYRVGFRATKAAILREPLYYYRERPGSRIKSFNEHRLDALEVSDRILAWILENAPEVESAARDRRFSAHFNILLLMKKHGADFPHAMEKCMRVLSEESPRVLKDPESRLKNRLGARAYLYGGRSALKILSKFIKN